MNYYSQQIENFRAIFPELRIIEKELGYTWFYGSHKGFTTYDTPMEAVGDFCRFRKEQEDRLFISQVKTMHPKVVFQYNERNKGWIIKVGDWESGISFYKATDAFIFCAKTCPYMFEG